MKTSKIKSFIIIAIFAIMALGMNAQAASKNVTLEAGQKVTLKVDKKMKKASWKSNNTSVATVSNKGVVKAKKAGSATITAKAGKKSATWKVNVVKVQSGAQEEAAAETVQVTAAGMNPEEARIFNAMMALKAQYPEGMSWTNNNYYGWNGGIYAGGYGCAAFAFMLSDAAFGEAPARMHTNFADIHVGDIVRLDNNSHSVIILKVTGSSVIVAEGNYGKAVHWGREISLNKLQQTADNVITRY